MKVIGLTGSIASGKSFVAQVLTRLGAKVIDADHLARDIVSPGSLLLRALIKEFGADILNKEGSLNRVRLAEIVFSDNAMREKLNSLMHPAIIRMSEYLINKERENGTEILFYMAPLIVETGRYKNFSEIWVVDVDAKRQLDRLMVRDGIDMEQAKKKIKSQMSTDEKKKYADVVIDNNGVFEETEEKVSKVFENLKKRITGSDCKAKL